MFLDPWAPDSLVPINSVADKDLGSLGIRFSHRYRIPPVRFAICRKWCELEPKHSFRTVTGYAIKTIILLTN